MPWSNCIHNHELLNHTSSYASNQLLTIDYPGQNRPLDYHRSILICMQLAPNNKFRPVCIHLNQKLISRSMLRWTSTVNLNSKSHLSFQPILRCFLFWSQWQIKTILWTHIWCLVFVPTSNSNIRKEIPGLIISSIVGREPPMHPITTSLDTTHRC